MGIIIVDIDCGCGNRHSEHRRLARPRLDNMEEFYVGNSAEQTTAGSSEILPHYEGDLPASLLHALEKYKRGCGKMCPASIACEESSTAASTPANGTGRSPSRKQNTCKRGFLDYTAAQGIERQL